LEKPRKVTWYGFVWQEKFLATHDGKVRVTERELRSPFRDHRLKSAGFVTSRCYQWAFSTIQLSSHPVLPPVRSLHYLSSSIRLQRIVLDEDMRSTILRQVQGYPNTTGCPMSLRCSGIYRVAVYKRWERKNVQNF
jgi:hypothetical protein